jgi:hypothetical protein
MLTPLTLRMSTALACHGFWILSLSFLLVHSLCDAVCSVLACDVLLVGDAVADAAVPAGERVLLLAW